MKIPVIIIIFNRPEKTKLLFNSISKYKPENLFIISDGPRNNHEGDLEKVLESREIFKNIDWNCEIFFNNSEKNLGCRERIISGLNWVFEKVDKAIILEDDCIPSKEFFPFMEEMLIKYQINHKIGSICGSNLLSKWDRNKDSYFYSKYCNCWGWGTWRDRWQKIDTNLDNLEVSKSKKILKSYLGSYRAHIYWHFILNKVKKKKIDSWAYIWSFTNFINGNLHITPKYNLVSNIGIGKDSTHTKTIPVKYISSTQMKNKLNFPLTHPSSIFPDDNFDINVENKIFSKSLYNRFIWLLKKLNS
jgi:hypothetical protein